MYKITTSNPSYSFCMMDLRWEHPFSSICVGGSGCGKTTFVKKFIENLNTLVDTEISEITWCYVEWQKLYQTIKHDHPRVRFHRGLIPLEEMGDGNTAKLLIIDDMMGSKEAEDIIPTLFTRGSHHRSISVIYLTQNLFHQGKNQRDIALNCHYLVVFKNPRDRSQILHLARQVFPENPRFVVEAFQDATAKPHSYLLFDFRQKTEDIYRFRANIFPDNGDGDDPVVYLPKSSIKHSYSSASGSLAHDE